MIKFLNSVKLTKPAADNSQSSRPAQPAATTGGASSGISHSITNFNDGWTATIHDEYVLVIKGSANVYLFYGAEMPADAPKNNLKTEYYWQKMVAPRYNI